MNYIECAKYLTGLFVLLVISCDKGKIDEPSIIVPNYSNTAEFITSISDTQASHNKEILINGGQIVKETIVFDSSLNLYPIYRIPSVFTTPKGTILCSCENKAVINDAGVIDILVARKEYNSDEWNISRVFKHSEEKGRLMDPIFVKI